MHYKKSVTLDYISDDIKLQKEREVCGLKARFRA